jgi:hypothetical protein
MTFGHYPMLPLVAICLTTSTPQQNTSQNVTGKFCTGIYLNSFIQLEKNSGKKANKSDSKVY